MKKKQEVLPEWNLSDLYEGFEDSKIAHTLRVQKKRVKAFEARYRGKINSLAGRPKEIMRMLREYESIYLETGKPLIFSSLKFAESTLQPKAGAFMQAMRKEYTQITQQMLFVDLELLALDERKFSVLVRDKALRPLRHYLKKLQKSRPHRRSEEVERVVQDMNLTGRSAFTRLFEEETGGRRYRMKNPERVGPRVLELSQSGILNYLYSPNSRERKAAASAFTAGLKEDSRRTTYIFNTLLEDKRVSDAHFKFNSPEASRHMENEIEQSMVDVMSEVVAANYKIVQSFYSFKKDVLKTKELFDYDRYAPIKSSKKVYSWDDAQRLVLSAFYNFSSRFGEIAQEFFDRGWIDAAKRDGKRGGAFCSYTTPDKHPYVFINFEGNIRDVFTLAHELGHAIHGYLMRDQSYLNFETPLTLAETASIFSEMVLFESLKSTMPSKEERRAMYIAKIESIFATVFRQISMYRFEQDLHKARRERGELATADINAIWRKRQEEMFASSVTLTSDYDYWWGYIGHFIHTPFYVYAYAFGELLCLSLYAKYKKEGDDFVPKLTKLLAAGGSESPEELLRPLKIDLRNREFWQGGIRFISRLVNEARSI